MKLDQSRCTSQSEQRVTTLEVLHHAEARAPYVAAELRNPICVYAYMVNGPKAAPGKMAAPTTQPTSVLPTSFWKNPELYSKKSEDSYRTILNIQRNRPKNPNTRKIGIKRDLQNPYCSDKIRNFGSTATFNYDSDMPFTRE